MDVGELVRRDNISIITMANSGYLDFTRNCIKSLEKIGIFNLLKVYCVDEKCYRELGKEYKNVVLMDHVYGDSVNNLQKFPRTWQKMMKNSNTESTFKDLVFLKFNAISHALENSSFVMLVDGDVVFLNDKFLNYAYNAIENFDILFQSETDGVDKDNPCSGLMFMKSTNVVKDFFNLTTVMEDESWDTFIGDQDYVHKNCNKLNYNYLPVELYPNGRYFQKHRNNISPYMVHYNWLRSTQKLKIMRRTNGWYI